MFSSSVSSPSSRNAPARRRAAGRMRAILVSALLVMGSMVLLSAPASAVTGTTASDLAKSALDRPSSCGNFAARTAYVTTPSGNTGLIQVSYSSCTRNVWAYLLSYAPPCRPGVDYCGGALIHRNSDGAERSCGLPAGGTSCNSDQLSDANVTSYAYGEIDNGPFNGTGRTANW